MNWLKGTLIFCLLMEWLRPLPSVAPIENADIFVWLLGYLCLIAITNLFSFIKLLLQLGGTMGAIYYLFHPRLLENQSWREYISLEWSYNYELLWNMDYWSTTAFFRTVAFMLVLWLVTEVVYRAVLQKNQGIWFTLATAAYLILLDIATVYDVKWALVRMVVYSLQLLALLQMRQVERQWIQLSGTRYQRSRWVLTSFAVILTITSVAYAVPKPQEADIETWRYFPQDRYSQQKVGYQSEDSILGGPFIEDESLVFLARTPEKHYWRGESRSIYTGSEWKDGGEPLTPMPSGTDSHYQPLIKNMKTAEEIRTKVEFPSPQYNVLFYGGQLKEIIAMKPEKAALYTKGNHDIQVEFPSDDQPYISAYELLIEIPIINEELLKESSNEYPREVQGNLQLPLSLPNRVQKLANDLTKDQKDPYSKVLAIQAYLKNTGGYIYEKEEVPYLEQGQDFVDQFLFESKKGYCDHFSTSMIVLLRSIGIPARYVKGFSTGDMIKQEDHLYEVTVKNKHAHSWPEVYFTGYGWIPFEPTPGFIHPVKHDLDQANQKENAEPVSAFIPPSDQDDQGKLNDKKEDRISGQESGNELAIWFYFIMAMVLIGFFVMWKKKRYLMQFWFLHQQSKRVQKVEGLARVYLSFLSLLGKIYDRRRKSESLQEFVNRMTLQADTRSELKDLTHWYEKHLYGKPSGDPKEWNNKRNILQKLIKYFLS